MTDELFPQQEWNGAPLEEVQALFDFWKTTFNKRASTVLDDKRKDKLATALRHYGMDTCKHAILGCSMSDFHMGNNNRNKVYNDLTLIFRNAEKKRSWRFMNSRPLPSTTSTNGSTANASPLLHRHQDPRRPHRPRPLGRKCPTGQPISARPREARHQPLLVRQPVPVPTYHRRRSARLATRSHRRTTPPASCLPETHQPQMETASNQPTHTSQK